MCLYFFFLLKCKLLERPVCLCYSQVLRAVPHILFKKIKIHMQWSRWKVEPLLVPVLPVLSPNQVNHFFLVATISFWSFFMQKSSKGECIFPIQVYSFLPKVGIHIHLLSTFFSFKLICILKMVFCSGRFSSCLNFSSLCLKLEDLQSWNSDLTSLSFNNKKTSGFAL